MSLLRNEQLIPPGELAMENKVGASVDSISAQNEWREYGRLQMEDWVDRGYINPDFNVLDIGCGLGRVAHTLAGWLQTGSYTGIDITRSSIEWCQEHYKEFSNFHFLHADLSNSHYNRLDAEDAASYKFPIKSNSIDFSWSTSLFTHMRINEIDNYLGEIARVAKPGCLTWNNYFILDEVSEPLALAGIENWGALRHPIEGGLYMTEDNPDHVIAFYLDNLLELHRKHDFEIIHIGYGGWSGRPGSKDNGQDVILARKL